MTEAAFQWWWWKENGVQCTGKERVNPSSLAIMAHHLYSVLHGQLCVFLEIRIQCRYRSPHAMREIVLCFGRYILVLCISQFIQTKPPRFSRTAVLHRNVHLPSILIITKVWHNSSPRFPGCLLAMQPGLVHLSTTAPMNWQFATGPSGSYGNLTAEPRHHTNL